VYGELTWFEPALPDHPLAAGMPAGSVTDDTEQALVLADVLLEGGGRIDRADLAHRLLAWQADMRARGSLDLLGPSSNRAFEALLAGESPDTTGRYGTTNGAAMRIAPVGVAFPSDDLPALIDAVVEASSVSHNTGVALAGAAAVAAAVSAGVDGADLCEAVETGRRAATLAAARGYWVAAADVSARIGWAVDLMGGVPPSQAADLIYTLVGTSLATQESVPAAFAALAVHPDDPWAALLLAASLGGDCDTIAAMTGAVAGACAGVDGLPDRALATVRSVNDLDLDVRADRLLQLRTRCAPGTTA
jgi:ADP-ribosylglycohydrolase